VGWAVSRSIHSARNTHLSRAQGLLPGSSKDCQEAAARPSSGFNPQKQEKVDGMRNKDFVLAKKVKAEKSLTHTFPTWL
jgi:hypothetical protein